MIGFVNALGILIFCAQVPHILNVPWIVYPLFALTIAIVLVMPRVTEAIPAPLVAVVVVTAIVMTWHLDVPNVGGNGTMAPGMPGITQFVVPLNLETLLIIWPTALSVAFVGLLESLLTAKLVDDITDTRSHKGRKSWALGVANIAAGLLRRDRRMRDDRPDGGQREDGPWPHAHLDGGGSPRAARARHRAQRPDGANSDGCARRGDDDRSPHDGELAQPCAGDVHADAEVRNDRDDRHHRDHGRDRQSGASG